MPPSLPAPKKKKKIVSLPHFISNVHICTLNQFLYQPTSLPSPMVFHSFLSFSFHRKPKTNQKETQSFIFNLKKKKKKKKNVAPIYATAYREKKPPKTHRPIFFFLFLRLLLHTNPPNSCAWGDSVENRSGIL